MDAAPAVKKPVAYSRFLPYWAVFQADMHQALRSWVYRVWVLVSLSATIGYLLYRYALAHEAGIIQPASTLVSDLLRWTVYGSAALIVVLTAGSISSERGTMVWLSVYLTESTHTTSDNAQSSDQRVRVKFAWRTAGGCSIT